MDLKTFALTISQIAEEKGISEERVIETVEIALAAAYKKEYGKRGQIIRAKFNPISGDVKFWQVKIVVDETMLKPEEGGVEEGGEGMFERGEAAQAKAEAREAIESEKELEKEKALLFSQGRSSALGEGGELSEKKIKFNPEKHIMVEEAKGENPDVKPGDEVTYALETKLEFGRIAAQTAKQVIIQRIREAEKESIFSEFKAKEGEILSGIVQRVEGRNVFMDIGKTTGLLLYQEQIPGEMYRLGQRVKALLLRVEENPKGTVVLLSRAYPKMLSKLFELEVPEIAAGTVVVKSIAREPGSRSKIAVMSKEEGIDPIGSCVGQKGTRVNAVIAELNGEKIDIIEWAPDEALYVAHALSPAKVVRVDIDKERAQAAAYTSPDQLSLAIGREGQNVRLAAKLTGWKIDVRSIAPEESVEQKNKEDGGDEKQSPVATSQTGLLPGKEADSKEEKKRTKKTKKQEEEKEPSQAEPRTELGSSTGEEPRTVESDSTGTGEATPNESEISAGPAKGEQDSEGTSEKNL
jgi:N utilization substance protein A